MKNTFGKALLSLTFFLTLISCDKDKDEDIITQTPINLDTNFFNLKEGNTWVYKKYESDYSDTENLVFKGSIDTVFIEKELYLNGIKFYKQRTKQYKNSSYTKTPNEYVDFLRINESGHLLRSYAENYQNLNEYLIHPGNDFDTWNYPAIFQPVGNFGNVNYYLKPLQEITIEDKNYKTYPFMGEFTPFDETKLKKVTGFGEYFQENLGCIKRIVKRISNLLTQEYRLTTFFNQPVKKRNDVASQLDDLYDEILVMANPKPCTDSSKWDYIAIGHKPCGGPERYIAYYKEIDVVKFKEKVKRYTTLELEHNIDKGAISTCDFIMPPTKIDCVENRPILIYEYKKLQ